MSAPTHDVFMFALVYANDLRSLANSIREEEVLGHVDVEDADMLETVAAWIEGIGKSDETARLDWLERFIAHDPLVLHDGDYPAVPPFARPPGLGTTKLGRTLREAIDTARATEAVGVEITIRHEERPNTGAVDQADGSADKQGLIFRQFGFTVLRKI